MRSLIELDSSLDDDEDNFLNDDDDCGEIFVSSDILGNMVLALLTLEWF